MCVRGRGVQGVCEGEGGAGRGVCVRGRGVQGGGVCVCEGEGVQGGGGCV